MGDFSTEFTTLEIVRKFPDCPSVVWLYINNPSRLNALTLTFFSELPKAISLLDESPSVRIIVLSGRGDNFSAGIDISVLHRNFNAQNSDDSARASERLHRQIKGLQEAMTALERCRKPIIAEIDGACIGGGMHIITACDIRYCTEKTTFSAKEVDLGLAPDFGALQRLPRIVGFGNAVDLALTGRKFSGQDAKEMNLVSRVFSSKKEMEEGVRILAEAIAEKSPIAVIGTKQVLLKSRDLTIQQGLDYVAAWNSAMLLSDDVKEAIKAYMQKRKPIFAKL